MGNIKRGLKEDMEALGWRKLWELYSFILFKSVLKMRAEHCNRQQPGIAIKDNIFSEVVV